MFIKGILEAKFQPIAEISKAEFVGVSFGVQYICEMTDRRRLLDPLKVCLITLDKLIASVHV